MIELLGVGAPREDGGWRLHRVCASFRRGEVTLVVSHLPEERDALLDAVAARIVPEEGRVWVDRVPVSAATTWLPADRAPDAGRIYRDTRSLTRTLAKLGIDDFRRQRTRISAAIADAADAARLRLAPGRPLIVVDGTDVTADGRPILTTRARLAADRIELVIET